MGVIPTRFREYMFKYWLMAIRPKTLPASISPVLLGSALAFYSGHFSFGIFVLALMCALLLQVAVNFANDLFDAHSGVDTERRMGPVRVTQSGLISSRQLAIALGLVSVLAMASGLVLVYYSSLWLLILGLAALVAVFAYSGGPWPLASHGLGEVTVLAFFGWLAVGGTYYAHTSDINWSVMAYGTVAGLISAAIMLVNNIRDISTDKPAAKHTLAVILGDSSARRLYKALLITALLLHIAITYPLGLYSFIPLVFAAPLIRKLLRNIILRQGAELNQQLAQTAQLELVYCILMSGVLVAVSL